MTEFSDDFATQSIISSKPKADMPNVLLIPLQSFRRIFRRVRRRHRTSNGRLTSASNERVRSGDIEGQHKKRICPMIHSVLNSGARRVKCNSEANTVEKRGLLILDCWLLTVDC